MLSNFQRLQEDNIIEYNPVKNEAELTFLLPREDDYTINRVSKEIKQFISQKKNKSEDLIQFINNKAICRSIQVLSYFDEVQKKKCGICDVCISENRMSTLNLSSKIIELLKINKCLSSSEISQFLIANEKDILIHLRQLLTDGKIKINHQNKYQLNL